MQLVNRLWVVTVVGAALVSWTARPAGAQAELTAVVRKVAHRPGGGDWQKSKVGVRLGGDSSVRTGKRSNCEVKLGKNIIRLSERSAITLKGNQVALEGGKVYGHFETDTIVKAHNTVATIKGTGALFDLVDVEGVLSLVIDILSGGPATVDIVGVPNPFNLVAGQRLITPAAGVIPGGPQPQVRQCPNTESFKDAENGNANAATDDMVSGANTQVTPGASDTATIRNANLESRDAAQEGGSSEQHPGSSVESCSDSHSHYYSSSGQMMDIPAAGMTRALLAPRLKGDAFAYKRDGNRALAGLRLQTSAVYGGAFWEAAVQPTTLFRGNEDTDLTDAYGVFRSPDSYGDLIVGRQRFLKGPVDLVTTGTLINQDIMDAITWSPPVKKKNPRLALDLSIIHDAFPFNLGGNQGGWHARAEYHADRASIGLSALDVNGIANTDTGVTVDVATPLLPGKLDVYGEFGDNIFSQNIRTFGAYFPALYDKLGIDAYLETTKGVGAVPGITVLRAYYEVGPNLTVLATADKIYSQSGINMGVGLVAKLLH